MTRTRSQISGRVAERMIRSIWWRSKQSAGAVPLGARYQYELGAELLSVKNYLDAICRLDAVVMECYLATLLARARRAR